MTQTPARLILGSGSPRRLELLALAGFVPHDIRPPDIDETPRAGEVPRAYCGRIAREKADAMHVAEGEVVLVADTTVALGRRILGKPVDVDEARAFLTALSGRRHRVITALVVRTRGESWFRDVVSTVRFKRLSTSEIDQYLATGDWHGKAGGYAIQGPAASFIPWMSGSHSAIVGLPLAEATTLLNAAGVDRRLQV